MVYHYTTIESFYSMLANYKASEDKDNFIFWASNVLNQNDPKEMSLRYKDIIDVVRKIEDTKPYLHGLKRLSTIKDNDWLFGYSSENIEKKINIFCTDINYSPFTISFSHQLDKLLMWSMYASNGTGLCLAFDEKLIQNDQPDLILISENVSYGNNPDHYIDVVSKLYEMYLNAPFYIDDPTSQKSYFLTMMLSGIAPFIKNKAYEDEHEYRLAYYKTSNDKPKVYTRLTNRLNVVNYVEIRIPMAALKHIVIGPCANYPKVKKLLVENMKSCYIERIYKSFVSKSEVPYRIY